MRVSSQAMMSTPASVSSARRVMSPRLPIGVATRCRPGAAFGAVRIWPATVKGPPGGQAVGLLLAAHGLGVCSGIQQPLSKYTTSGPAQEPIVAGTGQVKVGLILPLSAPGNAGVAAQSMKNAAEMALAEFQNPNIQLLIKDDGGNPQGAQQGTQQALDEGAEIILGPLFSASLPATAQLARTRVVSVIAFSTDS